ncbi:hypothetical protein [Glaciibacter sp. 2TAF33]|uniref:hypothetical protein n=1 Tax=Glaciibacter sp. 2TAF33 TaxID=3233015 RepID=UPI003F8E6777
MQWWNSFVNWLTDADTLPFVYGAIVLVVSLVVGSVLAAWISRGAIRGLIDQRDREVKAAAIGALIDAATEASVWNSLTPQEQVMADRAVGQADIQVRLLPIRGAGTAANWAAHQLAEFKRTSATFGYQLEPAVHEFRDRLIEWQNKPSRARKIFQSDLERWGTQSAAPESGLLAEQDAWVAQQHHDQFSAPEARPFPAAPAPVPSSPASATAPSTETQRLLDDVQALEVRPASTGNHTAAVNTL